MVDRDNVSGSTDCLEFEINGKTVRVSNVGSQLKPQGNKVLIQKLKGVFHEFTRKSVIVVAGSSESTENRYTIALVLAVGEKVTAYKAGDYVVYGKWSGVDINIQDEKYSLIKDEEISAIIDFPEN